MPETREITDSFYRLHFNFVQDRANSRSEVRKSVKSQDISLSAVAEVDRLMWSTRHHEYKFAEISRYNIQQYIDILNLYSSFPNLEFHSLIADRHDNDAGLGNWNNDEWEAYIHFARELLAERLTRDVFAIVDLQGKPNKSNVYLEDVLCSVSSVKGCLRATSDMSIYLQLVNFLKSKLGMTQREPFLQKGQSFKRWDTPSAFTVWKREW